jgi:predicted PurR-regulated permease PerM
MAERQSDLTRDTLAVVFLFVLIAASVWILLPFLTAVVWATMIVVAPWFVLLMLQRWLLGRRWLAVTSVEAGRVESANARRTQQWKPLVAVFSFS